uniref:Ig-like domain-containing protein n=1 Tax=Cyprinodon variegatus TaxID=28743 RepID=A0A3Q2CAN9_CYPVA
MSQSRLPKNRMKIFLKFLLICHFASPEPHSLVYVLCGISGSSKLPEFFAYTIVDGVHIGSCENSTDIKPRTPWINKLFEGEPQHLQWLKNKCQNNWLIFQAAITTLKQRFNQSEGIHIYQRMNGCFWDDETEDFDAFNQYGYDGEDLIRFDLNTLTWVTPRHQTVITKHNWDTDSLFWKYALTEDCKRFLQLYLNYGRNTLQKSVHPSVSLLQKISSPVVTCHATGFYPERAMLYWRKNGEEIHEGVENGEILLNNDGTFQISVDLSVSSINEQDWNQYDCLFQFSGLEDKITTRLDRAMIKTNPGSSVEKHFVFTAGVLLLLTGLVSAAVVVWRRKNRNGL